MSKPKVGDWVQVWGQVAEGKTHPEDVLIRFTSHNADYLGDVHENRVFFTEGRLPAFALRCTALTVISADESEGTADTYARCVLHEGHSGNHVSMSDGQFEARSVAGHIEEH
jgi:hypothetical protein